MIANITAPIDLVKTAGQFLKTGSGRGKIVGTGAMLTTPEQTRLIQHEEDVNSSNKADGDAEEGEIEVDSRPDTQTGTQQCQPAVQSQCQEVQVIEKSVRLIISGHQPLQDQSSGQQQQSTRRNDHAKTEFHKKGAGENGYTAETVKSVQALLIPQHKEEKGVKTDGDSSYI